ncbi:unnamed protein product [Closterium sp. Naga37s-1]|nr:unnamed protein product [Closterium sp. Naga37s-1]
MLRLLLFHHFAPHANSLSRRAACLSLSSIRPLSAPFPTTLHLAARLCTLSLLPSVPAFTAEALESHLNQQGKQLPLRVKRPYEKGLSKAVFDAVESGALEEGTRGPHTKTFYHLRVKDNEADMTYKLICAPHPDGTRLILTKVKCHSTRYALIDVARPVNAVDFRFFLRKESREQREQRGVDRLGNRRGSAPRLLGVYRRHGREDRHRLEELTENLEDGESTLSGITIDVPPGGDDYNEGDYSAENAGGSNSGSMGYTGAGTVSYGAGLRRFPSGLEGMEGVGSGGVGFEGVVSGGAGRVEEEEVEAELLAMEAAVEYNVRVVTCQGSPVRWHNCHVCVRPNAVLLDAAGCIVVDGRELRARDGSPVVLEEQGESLIHALIDFSPPLVHLSFIHAFLDLDPRAVVLQETAVRVNRWLSDRQNQHEVVAQFLTCDRRL